MMRFICCCCVILAPQILFAQPAASYDDVLVMINDRSANSVEIGNFFAAHRNIPDVNIFHFQHDTTTGIDVGETIDSAAFVNEIFWPLENYMADNNLATTINYIVTTKGCPLRVTAPNDTAHDKNGNGYLFSGLSSFNDCVALANGKDTIYMLVNKPQPFFSPYSFQYGPIRPFQHDFNAMPFYLTTRLDAYTVDQVKQLILRAENPAHVGHGNFVLDADPEWANTGNKEGNQWLYSADSILRLDGLSTIYDSTNIFLTNQKNVVGYCSWGSNDSNFYRYTTHAIPHNTYVNGAIAETFVSTGARSFNPGTPFVQSLIADLIAEGVTGVKGYTDEPLLDAIARPQYLFPAFVQRYNLAESYWYASEWLAWRQVVIGDPKYTLKDSNDAVEENISSPVIPNLSNGFPNPFADATTIPFSLAQAGKCKITISDVLGRVRTILCDEFLQAGEYTRTFSAKNFVSGTYICSLETHGVVINKMVNVER